MADAFELLVQWPAGTLPYRLALGFVAAYPIVTGVMWTITSLIFYRRNERDPIAHEPDSALPFVSVVVAAYCEEAVIEHTLSALLALDYPRYEIVVVDDGSTDGTVALLEP
jgi:biofilm PGA synthesis N-glycosyltransferase PgaC